MKSSRMKFTKKLKSIKAGEYLNQDRILQVLSAADGISDYLPKISNPISQITVGSMWRSPQKIANETELVENNKEGEEASGSFVGDEENVRPPVNHIPRIPCDRKASKSEVTCGSDDIGIGRKSFGSGFRRPDLNSRTLFDPKLLEAFELAVVCFRRINDFSRKSRFDVDEEEIAFPVDEDENSLSPVLDIVEEEEDGNALLLVNEISSEVGLVKRPIGEDDIGKDENALHLVTGGVEEQEECKRKDENVLLNDAQPNEGGSKKDDHTLQIVESVIEEVSLVGDEECGKYGNALLDPLLEFEERCPRGGEESVVFYTTSLQGIRKTFDDCNMIRFLLDSFKVKYYERDVSMHREYREELRRVSAAEETEVLPPVLFVKGRCIGGAQRVLGLHEQGKFKVLFDGVPLAGDKCCRRCDGFRFLMCGGCRGSRRIISGDGTRIQCLLCNENGLIVCVDCS